MEAKDQIREIHKLLDENTRFRYISGWAIIAAGLLASGFYIMFSNLLNMQWWKPLNKDHFLNVSSGGSIIEVIWPFLALLFCVAVLSGIIVLLKIPDNRKHGAFKQLSHFATTYILYILGGFAIALCLIKRIGTPDALILCLPLMMIMYGLAQVHVARIAIAEFRYFGIAVFLLGLAGIILPLWSWMFWLLAMGAGHVILGIVVLKKYKI